MKLLVSDLTQDELDGLVRSNALLKVSVVKQRFQIKAFRRHLKYTVGRLNYLLSTPFSESTGVARVKKK